MSLGARMRAALSFSCDAPTAGGLIIRLYRSPPLCPSSSSASSSPRSSWEKPTDLAAASSNGGWVAVIEKASGKTYYRG